MKTALLIGLGSFIGGMLRYGVSLIQKEFAGNFPWATLSVNLIGCFLIGIVYGWSSKGNTDTIWQLFLTTGILGGFTTFSAFSLETVNMFRSGQTGFALLYILISVLVGLLATLIGLKVSA